MFIINALCCITQQNQPCPSNRGPSVKRVTIDRSRTHDNISQPQISEGNSQKRKLSPSLQTQERSGSFGIQHHSIQGVISDKSSAGSHSHSLFFETTDKYCSPVTQEIIQTYSSQTDFGSLKNKNFYGLDFIDTDVKQWSIKNILKFLGRIGLKKYSNSFYQNKIKGKDLITLSEKEMKQDLSMTQSDVRLLFVYVQLLKQQSDKKKQQKVLYKTFSGRKLPSLSRAYRNTHSCRKVLSTVRNPIIEQIEEENAQQQQNRINDFSSHKDIYSTNLSQTFQN